MIDSTATRGRGIEPRDLLRPGGSQVYSWAVEEEVHPDWGHKFLGVQTLCTRGSGLVDGLRWGDDQCTFDNQIKIPGCIFESVP